MWNRFQDDNFWIKAQDFLIYWKWTPLCTFFFAFILFIYHFLHPLCMVLENLSLLWLTLQIYSLQSPCLNLQVSNVQSLQILEEFPSYWKWITNIIYAKKHKERGDNGLFITLVPKVALITKGTFTEFWLGY